MTKEKTDCDDKKCPFHGKVSIRGKTFTGTVVSVNPHRTAVVEWGRLKYIPKYERYEKGRTKVSAHNSHCVNAKKGETVEIKECRPLSKTKNFVITKILGKNIEFMEKEDRIEEEMEKTEGKTKEEKAEKKAEKKETKKEAEEKK
jgi:small subunit ribosomal protein S17